MADQFSVRACCKELAAKAADNSPNIFGVVIMVGGCQLWHKANQVLWRGYLSSLPLRCSIVYSFELHTEPQYLN
jgi:hypothetical protein